MTGAEHMVQKHLHEQEVQALRARHEQADGSPKKKWKRVETEVEDCNAIYIMLDPKRPDCCKIGAGNGNCKARETVAQLWTDGEAKLVHVEPIGSGLALRAETSARKKLERAGHRVNGEWVHCKWSLAVPVLEALGRQARDQWRGRVRGFPLGVTHRDKPYHVTRCDVTYRYTHLRMCSGLSRTHWPCEFLAFVTHPVAHGIQKMVRPRSGPMLIEHMTPRSTALMTPRWKACRLASGASAGYRR